MCGLAGVLHFDGQAADPTALQRMAEALRHRGPDDFGVWADGPAGLVNTRLAIIDLTADAHQPMSNAQCADRRGSGRLWIAYNGEIYNFPELRRALAARGHVLRSRSDTETVLHLYEEQGPACLSQLRGMFALAIWEAREGRLFLARDRLGKKPLYYWTDGERLVFGSEIKAVLAYPGVARAVNRGVLPHYLTYGYVPSPDTIFENVCAVRPAHYLLAENGHIVERPFWDAPMPADDSDGLAGREADWAERLIEKMREAVRLRLISDVPLGAFLSGGLDSSAVVALMAEAGDRPVKTFAIGFSDEPSFDERPFARRVAAHLGAKHHEFAVPMQSVDLIPRLVWHLDQPFGDSSAIPTYLVAKCAREHVTVALTGDGGDELFAGYERFRAARLAETYRRAAPAFAHRALNGVLAVLPQGTGYRDPARRLARFVRSARRPLPERYLGWVGVMSDDVVEGLVGSGSDGVAEHFRAYFRSADQDASRSADPLPALLDVNLRSYLPDDLLVKADRMSMAASLEARSPFLDHELVEFAARIPPDLKLRGNLGKYLLRRAFRDKLPPEILRRQKHGFGVPVGRWFRTGLKGYLQDNLLSARSLGRGYFRPDAVRRLVDDHLSGRRDHGHALWTLLTFEIWHQVFMD